MSLCDAWLGFELECLFGTGGRDCDSVAKRASSNMLHPSCAETMKQNVMYICITHNGFATESISTLQIFTEVNERLYLLAAPSLRLCHFNRATQTKSDVHLTISNIYASLTLSRLSSHLLK